MGNTAGNLMSAASSPDTSGLGQVSWFRDALTRGLADSEFYPSQGSQIIYALGDGHFQTAPVLVQFPLQKIGCKGGKGDSTGRFQQRTCPGRLALTTRISLCLVNDHHRGAREDNRYFQDGLHPPSKTFTPKLRQSWRRSEMLL